VDGSSSGARDGRLVGASPAEKVALSCREC
jgi:hypothetical protein